MKPINLLALDVGERRIGIAMADTATKIPIPKGTIVADESAVKAVLALIAEGDIGQVVIGYPRNQTGEATRQTVVSQAFGDRLRIEGVKIVYQDESLTSVAAEDFLRSSRREYTKGDIDAYAAAIILTDYLEAHYA